MFSECEQWRKDIKLDELVKSFDFEENPLVMEVYPRYYHKTDKVTSFHITIILTVGWKTYLH